MVDVDEMLYHAGDFGPYQLLLLALFCVTNILSSLDYFGQTFLSVKSPHWCRLPELEQTTTAEQRRTIWLPPNDPNCSRSNESDTPALKGVNLLRLKYRNDA
uniref:Uncharacterized protein n=1 Tax=Timema tahoe TaxID=61484 RepID=A0A7R9P109_9NEOP|nr:unnamed protein product [Timema tahoe]